MVGLRQVEAGSASRFRRHPAGMPSRPVYAATMPPTMAHVVSMSPKPLVPANTSSVSSSPVHASSASSALNPLPSAASPETAYPGALSPRLRAARRLTKRAFRQRERAFLAEGPQAVAEAFHGGAPVSDLFVTAPAKSRHQDLVGEIAGAGVPVHLVSGEVMDDLAQTVTPQGLLAVCGFVDVPLAAITAPNTPRAAPSRSQKRS